jgi:hypothetical protein
MDEAASTVRLEVEIENLTPEGNTPLSEATNDPTVAGTASGYMSSALRNTTIEPEYTTRIPLDDHVTCEISGCCIGVASANYPMPQIKPSQCD